MLTFVPHKINLEEIENRIKKMYLAKTKSMLKASWNCWIIICLIILHIGMRSIIEEV